MPPASGRKTAPEPAAGDALDDLLRRAVARDPAAAKEFWTLSFPIAHAVVRAMLGPGPDVADLVQEVFIRFFNRISRLETATTAFAYLRGVAVRVAQEERRRRRVRELIGLSPSGHLPDVAASSHPEQAVAVQRVYDRLQALSSADLALFVLRYVQELQIQELAAALDMSLSTAKRRLARLNKRLDRLLRDYPEFWQVGGPRDVARRPEGAS